MLQSFDNYCATALTARSRTLASRFHDQLKHLEVREGCQWDDMFAAIATDFHRLKFSEFFENSSNLTDDDKKFLFVLGKMIKTPESRAISSEILRMQLGEVLLGAGKICR